MLKTKNNFAVIFMTALATFFISTVIALMIGSYNITPLEVIKTLFGYGTRLQDFAIFKIRLPRVLLAILVSSALSVSGTILQGITKNPLAEPGLLGINAGAALFVTILISLKTSAYYSDLSLSTMLLMPIVSIIGASFTAFTIYILAYKKGVTPTRLVLIGIGINTGLSALLTFLSLNLTTGDYNKVLNQTNGSLWGSNYTYISLTAPIIILFILISFYKGKVLDTMGLGDELATGLGVNIKSETRKFLVIATILAAVSTAVAGSIAFIGLIGPHISKRLVGPSAKKQMLISILISNVLILIADTLSRNLFSPIEIPVGITISVIGVPYFIYLMLKEN